MDSERCKKKVWNGSVYGPHQCSRKAVMGSYCKQHHPDTLAARKKKKDADYAAWSKHQENIYLQRRLDRACREALPALMEAAELSATYLDKCVWRIADDNCPADYPPNIQQRLRDALQAMRDIEDGKTVK